MTLAGGAEPAAAPPPGSPWDDAIEGAALAFVDLEMTGLDPASDRVVEVCIERWVGETRVASLASLVLPGTRAGGAAHVHGLDEAALAGAPSFASLAPQIHALLSGAVLVAHAARWDVAFLEAELARADAPLRIPHYVDTLVLARRAFAFRSYSLDALTQELAIPRGRAHRAEDDVAALRAVFARTVAVLAPVSVRDLLAGPHRRAQGARGHPPRVRRGHRARGRRRRDVPSVATPCRPDDDDPDGGPPGSPAGEGHRLRAAREGAARAPGRPDPAGRPRPERRHVSPPPGASLVSATRKGVPNS